MNITSQFSTHCCKKAKELTLILKLFILYCSAEYCKLSEHRLGLRFPKLFSKYERKLTSMQLPSVIGSEVLVHSIQPLPNPAATNFTEEKMRCRSFRQLQVSSSFNSEHIEITRVDEITYTNGKIKEIIQI